MALLAFIPCSMPSSCRLILALASRNIYSYALFRHVRTTAANFSGFFFESFFAFEGRVVGVFFGPPLLGPVVEATDLFFASFLVISANVSVRFADCCRAVPSSVYRCPSLLCEAAGCFGILSTLAFPFSSLLSSPVLNGLSGGWVLGLEA